MPSQIYNEGRVVGYSAYESYLRQHMALNGDSTSASEREWLASSLASGSAMLMRIPVNFDGLVTHVDPSNQWTFVELTFPEESRLCAANYIIAYLFEGKGIYDLDHPFFASKVGSYGSCISNLDDLGFHPNNPAEDLDDVPISSTIDNIGSLDNFLEQKLTQYSKIVDGIIVQPGSWTINPNSPPAYILDPDLSKHPSIRMQVAGTPSDFIDEIEILLVGFTDVSVLQGTTGVASSEGSSSLDMNGGFLGPACFPWASKVVFVPPALSGYFLRWRIDDLKSQLENIYSQIAGTYDVSNSYADLPLTSESVKNALMKITVDSNDTYAIALPNDTFSTPSDAPIIKLGEADGYLYWEDLLKALHYGPLGSQHAKIHVVQPELHQLAYDMKYATDGRGYIISKNGDNYSLVPYLTASEPGIYNVKYLNGNVTLEKPLLFENDKFKNKVNLIRSPAFEDEYTGQDYKKCFYKSSGDVVRYGTGPLFSDAKLDVIGYVEEYNNGTTSPNWHYTYTSNTLATLTLLKSVDSSYGITENTREWGQKFYLSDRANIQTAFDLIFALRRSSPNLQGTKSIIFTGSGVPILNTTSGAFKGSCISHMDVCAYINIGSVLLNLQNSLSSGKTLLDVVSVRCTSTNGKIEGVIYGKCYDGTWYGSSSNPGKVDSCEIIGSINTTMKDAGYLSNSGKASLVVTYQNGTTQTITNMNL